MAISLNDKMKELSAADRKKVKARAAELIAASLTLTKQKPSSGEGLVLIPRKAARTADRS